MITCVASTAVKSDAWHGPQDVTPCKMSMHRHRPHQHCLPGPKMRSNPASFSSRFPHCHQVAVTCCKELARVDVQPMTFSTSYLSNKFSCSKFKRFVFVSTVAKQCGSVDRRKLAISLQTSCNWEIFCRSCFSILEMWLSLKISSKDLTMPKYLVTETRSLRNSSYSSDSGWAWEVDRFRVWGK